MKDIIKKYWEGALLAQIGLGYILYEYFTKDEITSFGVIFLGIGNILLLGKLLLKTNS